MGGLHGGHYTAHAYNDIHKQWFEYNDSFCGKVKNPENIKSAGAYLLFYRRRAASGVVEPTIEVPEEVVQNADFQVDHPNGNGTDDLQNEFEEEESKGTYKKDKNPEEEELEEDDLIYQAN